MVVVACDKFKGTLTATEACEAVGGELSRIFPDEKTVPFPVADGGEGTAEVLGRLFGLKQGRLEGFDALMSPVDVTYYYGDDVVVADCASVLSLSLLGDRRDVMKATSWPVGDMLAKIVGRHGDTPVCLGVGGTSTCDGGAGLLQALGCRLQGIGDSEIVTPSSLRFIRGIEIVDAVRLPEITLLCDVSVPLLAVHGDSALTFVPQKGGDAGIVSELNDALSHWREVVGYDGVDRYGDGAGGGIPFALTRLFGATAVDGAGFIIRRSGIFEKLRPRLLVVGEGCLDNQSLLGKVTGRLADAARSNGIAVMAVAGKVAVDFAGREMFDVVIDASEMSRGRVPADAHEAVVNIRRAIEGHVSEIAKLI